MPKKLRKPLVAITPGMTTARFVQLVMRTLRQSGKPRYATSFLQDVERVGYDPERVRSVASHYVDIVDNT